MLERNPSHRILKKRLETISSWKDFRMSFLTMILDLNLHLLKSLRIRQFIFDKSDFFILFVGKIPTKREACNEISEKIRAKFYSNECNSKFLVKIRQHTNFYSAVSSFPFSSCKSYIVGE